MASLVGESAGNGEQQQQVGADQQQQDGSGGSSNNTALQGREMLMAVNPPDVMERHTANTKGKVRTRFPPEPNGYLHIGHAKSMNMNFRLAFEKLGVATEDRETYFRYDDTNPEAESREYIESIREDVEWLGWKPAKTTYSSECFEQLHGFAVQLIKAGKAYMCHQTKDDIAKCREVLLRKHQPVQSGSGQTEGKTASAEGGGGEKESGDSPWRDRPMEESLSLFEDMRKGKFAAGEATLRLKMDTTSPNPNMWDPVSYRVKFVPHPHIGDEWCIYPTYDYTHCIVDSLEDIDYSICTLEFETRRESYYWLLDALNIYRPKVFEFSRLNITYTVLSKRRLLKLVQKGLVRGWDDPRMPTIKGLRRRGLTADVINTFCNDIGVTRTDGTIEYEKLQHLARTTLIQSSPRAMACLEPIKVVLTNLSEPRTLEIPDLPPAPSNAAPSDKEAAAAAAAATAAATTHTVRLTREIYIDSEDFAKVDSPDYFGLAPGKRVGLKYGFVIQCDEVVVGEGENEIAELRCSTVELGEGEARPKGSLHWVSVEDGLPAELRVYDHLFSVEEPDDRWEAQLNPKSEIVYPNAVVDASVKGAKTGQLFQFERTGIFCVDKDSEGGEGKLVCNRTVSLKASGAKKKDTGRSRKEEQAAQAREKAARAQVPPEDMFKAQTDKYGKFDESGVPTHDAAGEELSKSAVKKLKKEWEKQKKLYNSASKGK